MGELIDKAKGKAKQVQGKLTGDKVREAEGVADELKGKAKGAFEELKTDAKRALRQDEQVEKTEEADENYEDGRTAPGRPA